VDAKSLFQVLIRENSDMLVAYLRAGVRDLHAVDDLYQETVLTAWRKLDSYDRDKPIGPWLRGIAGRLMLAHYRKTNRSAQPLDEKTLDWLNDRFAAIHSLPGDTLHGKLAALRECIDALPETYQRPITMRFTEERGLSEIETTLNLARETLKKRLSRGKSRLADCLERKLGLVGATS
jgi:RNA polymerase sigma-70 factor (ECF subfamily)